nr:uncharacterized protein LOC102459040 isoform X1 [Pelodiscus sinensis]XP_025035615.1 uncharacterized protein LOC102459040 isoform X2 [Pelodiscus sinensis]|eukprot:XP_006113333.1 uncharacterized protein LOC102459040 isoform X1 [Pelodiscus sinensis]
MAACTYVVRHARMRLRPLQTWLAKAFNQSRGLWYTVLSASGGNSLLTMVDSGGCGVQRDPLHCTSPLAHSGHRCLGPGLGSTPGVPQNPGSLVPCRAGSAHKCPGAQCSQESVQDLPVKALSPLCPGPPGQHGSCILHQQAGGSPVTSPLPRGSVPLGPVRRARHGFAGRVPAGLQKPAGRCSELVLWSPRVVSQGLSPSSDLPQVALSPTRPVCLSMQYQVSELLLPVGVGGTLLGGCHDGHVAGGHPLCFPSVPPNSQGSDQGQDLQVHGHPDSPQVAQTILVPYTGGHAQRGACNAPASSGSPHPTLGRGDHGSPESQVST